MIDGGEQSAAGEPTAPVSYARHDELELHLELDVEALVHRVDRASVRQLESLQRREADQRLIDEAVRSGFLGRGWEALETELIRYGLGVLKAWLYTGFIFTLAAIQGRAVFPRPREKLLLREEVERASLAGSSIAVGLSFFKERALTQGGWRVEGGASLTTYFMGAVVLTFPNEFRRWRSEHAPTLQEYPNGLVIDIGSTGQDPANLVIGRIEQQQQQQTFARLGPRRAAIVQLSLAGYSQEEIAELVSAGSVRAIEGVMHRWRKEEQERRRRDPDGGTPT